MTGWVRSSYCSGNGECIEVKLGVIFSENVLIRRTGDGEVYDSMSVTRAEWDAFIAAVKAGQFDHLTGDAHAD